MSFLVTGAAGFIGFHTAKALLERGDAVIGIDNLNAYYDVGLKMARLALLERFRNFTFHRLDIADRGAMEGFANAHKGIERVLHLAAQAGVRYSLVNPHAYVEANVSGHLNVLELCRRNVAHISRRPLDRRRRAASGKQQTTENDDRNTARCL